MMPPLSLVGASLPTYSTNPALTPPNNKNKVSGSSASNQRQGYIGEEIKILGEKIRNSETSDADLIQAALKIFFYLDHMRGQSFTHSARSRLTTASGARGKSPKLTPRSELQISCSLRDFELQLLDRYMGLVDNDYKPLSDKNERLRVLKELISERESELTGLLQELRGRLERTHSTALSPELTELLQELRVRPKGTHSKAHLRRWTVLLQKLWVRLGGLLPTTKKREAS